ncbi:hypothetical protein ABBQ32_007005 [Trebouxia sp. C0010 RCD-2024]
MATPMLRARQALRIIDRFERATAEGRGAAPGPSTTRELSGLDREHNVRGPNSTVQETVGSGSLEPLQGSSGQRSLQRPPSHTAVDIPELATRDSATVHDPRNATKESSGDAVPSVMPPTFTGGVAIEGTGHMPVPAPYQDTASIGPLQARLRSQTLIKLDRSNRRLSGNGSGSSLHTTSEQLPPTGLQRKMSPSEMWRQAAGDIGVARKHLKRDSPSGGPPQDPEDLFRLLKEAAANFTAPSTATAVPARKSRRPGWVPGKTDAKALWGLLTGSWLNLLLLVVPVGWIVHFCHLNSVLVFVLNIIGLIPLALILGEITEDLAVRFGPTIGGLLNATFGNVVELILSIVALTKGLYTVVAASLVGSILSNLLLVLGCCFLIGGIKYNTQQFSATVNKASCSLLFLACIAIVIPTAAPALYAAGTLNDSAVNNISHSTAIILVLVYVGYLFFQLKTHKAIFSPEDEDAEEPAMSLTAAIIGLTGITVVVAISAEFLTDAISDVSEKSGLSEAFLGLIILPIAGNACEHITAVLVAYKNKMDLAIGVALGSSIQIAIFVLPVLVLIGWAIGKDFSLDLDPFLVIILTLSVIHAHFVSSDGQSNWMMGVQLVGTYVLIALLFGFVHGNIDQGFGSLASRTEAVISGPDTPTG